MRIELFLETYESEASVTSGNGTQTFLYIVAFVAVLALLGLAGVPPLMGFFGKYLIFVDAITTNPALIIVALLNSGIGIYYYLRSIRSIVIHNQSFE